MKIESSNFASRLEKQFRIMSDLCGLNLNSPQEGLQLIPSKGKKIISLKKIFEKKQFSEKKFR